MNRGNGTYGQRARLRAKNGRKKRKRGLRPRVLKKILNLMEPRDAERTAAQDASLFNESDITKDSLRACERACDDPGGAEHTIVTAIARQDASREWFKADQGKDTAGPIRFAKTYVYWMYAGSGGPGDQV